jgi:tetratricopeptide (TPR) repeat protein
MAATTPGGSRTGKLRQALADARDGAERLAALLALARHFAEVHDGVNGLKAAREARRLALEASDWRATAQALNYASVSQYHRSDYVSALATAMDAWDCARRAAAPISIAESLYAIALALGALGENEAAMRVVERGLDLAGTDAALREPRVRLVGLKGLLCFREERMDLTERHCAEAVALCEPETSHLLALSHGNWGIACLRWAEQRMGTAEARRHLGRARRHLEIALQLAEAQEDAMRVADRMSLLGEVAFLEQRFEEAERLLGEALRRSLELDYVRVSAKSALCLGKLHLARGDGARAVEALRGADAQSRRGAPGDMLSAVKLLLADALERVGGTIEAEEARAAAIELRATNREHRERALRDARRLAARVLEAPVGAA